MLSGGHLFVGVLLLTSLFVLYYQYEPLYQRYGKFSATQTRRLSTGFDSRTTPPIFDSISVDDHASSRGSGISDVIDLKHCVGLPFQVYVHDLDPAASSLAHSLHSAMRESAYSTDQVVNACIFVYVATSRNEKLHELPFWSHNGAGVVVVFADGKVRDRRVDERNAIFVGPNDEVTTRLKNPLDFNLFVQVLTPNATNFKLLPTIYPFRPRRLLLSIFASTATVELQQVFSPVTSKLTLVDFKCRGSARVRLGFCEDDEFRADALKNSVFTLLMPGMERFAQRLHESLLYGSIPVVVGGGLDELPFARHVRWEKAVHFLPQLENLLNRVPIPQLLELRRNGRFLFENHLADTKVLTRALLTSIRHQLRLPAPMERPYHARVIHSTHPVASTPLPPVEPEKRVIDLDEDFDHLWNRMPVFMDVRPLRPFREMSHVLGDMDAVVHGLQTVNTDNKKFAQNLSGNYVDEKFTVVMPSYKRDKQLRDTLEKLNGTRFLDSIIVLWNDLTRPIPVDLIPIISVPIYIVNTSVNSLNTRFLPFDLIQTEAILNMDDDFSVPRDMIEFSFRVWRENRHAIVGPTSRIGFMRKPEVGVYHAHGACQQNMVLTSGAFLHRIYHYAYTHMLNSLIHERIARTFNCEDIAVNFMVSHLTRRPAVKTTPVVNIGGKFAQVGHHGLHQRGSSHYEERSRCIAFFVSIFGYNPLRLSEWRADPILTGGGDQCYAV